MDYEQLAELIAPQDNFIEATQKQEYAEDELYNSSVAWDFIQDVIMQENYCDIEDKGWHLQYPDDEPKIISVAEVLEVTEGAWSTSITAKCLCDDGRHRVCKATHAYDPGNYWEPPSEDDDFEWLTNHFDWK